MGHLEWAQGAGLAAVEWNPVREDLGVPPSEALDAHARSTQ